MLGMRIVKSNVVGEPYEDWSLVRSPSRARRRLAQGHPQNTRTLFRANGKVMIHEALRVIYVHPDDYDGLIARLEAEANKGGGA